MDQAIVNAIAVLLAFLVLIVVYKHIELTIQIRDILNVHLKANRDVNKNDENEEESGSLSNVSKEKM